MDKVESFEEKHKPFGFKVVAQKSTGLLTIFCHDELPSDLFLETAQELTNNSTISFESLQIPEGGDGYIDIDPNILFKKWLEKLPPNIKANCTAFLDNNVIDISYTINLGEFVKNRFTTFPTFSK